MTRMRRAANWPYRLSVALLFLILGGYIVWPMLSVLAQTFLTNPGELPDGTARGPPGSSAALPVRVEMSETRS